MIDLKDHIIFEDEDLIVVHKKAGIVVNRAVSQKDNLTIQELIERYLGIGEGAGVGDRAGFVHRLDKETSGILLVAKTEESFSNLQTQFQDRTVTKTYIALSHGKAKDEEFEIDAPILRDPRNRMRFAISATGREAQTSFRLLNKYRDDIGNIYSLIECNPLTGRTHQIRVHLWSLNLTIVHDDVYLGRKQLRNDKLVAPRLLLHNSFLSFSHPTSGEKMDFKLQLEQDFQLFLDTLTKI